MKYWDYSIPSDGLGEGWAKILIAEDGRFHAVSDYGNYAYWWQSIGDRSILEFLLRMESSPDYLCSKLKPERVLDPDASIRSVLDYILECRRKDDMDPDAAREMWNHVKSHGDDWEGFLRDDTTCEYIERPWEFAVTNYCSDVWAFATKTMPRLSALIREDLKK